MKKLTLKQAQQIKNEFGTPTYLYYLDKIDQQYQMIRKSLSNTCDVFYSMKANPLLGVCQFFARQAAGCEVSSKNELLTALKAGFNPGNIIFVGPGKRVDELTLCVQKKIKAIICESIDEIVMVNEIAISLSVTMPVMIRLNPEFQVVHAPIKMSGVATQFGITVFQFEKNIQKILSYKNINLCGIHIYNGSRILNENAIIENIDNILKCADRLSRQYKIKWECIDIGGGFGVPYFEKENNLNLNVVITKINNLFKQYNQTFPKTRFILELGRYLVSESGFLIASVISTKTNHGKNFAIIDAGMQCHFSSTGLNSFVQRNFPAVHISENTNNKNKVMYQIAGPLCTPGDVMLRDVEFSKIQRGDFIVLLNVGAYGYTASPIRFLSHDAPSEVLLFKNKMHLAREREEFSALLSSQKDLSTIYK